MIDAHLQTASAEDLLRWAIERHGNSFAVVTSFQAEGMVVLDIAAKISPNVRVLTLDTGRLPEETYAMIETVRARYGIDVETVLPDPVEMANMIEKYGPNLFYREVAMRRLCCEVRKVRPLERRLRTISAWATGLRREQSEQRQTVAKVEQEGGRLKLNPLADWSRHKVDEYTYRHNVPRHPLYAKGYTSIGCEPCTRPTQMGEGERAGRWWWEQDAAKECGLHFTAGGRLERRVDVLLREVVKVKYA